MASFQAKIGWKRPKKRKNKNYRSFSFVPTQCEIENSKKIAKKFKELKNTIMASFLARKSFKNDEKERK